MKLNICSGGCPIEGFIGIDINPVVKPDLIMDITKEKYPYEDGSVEEVRFMHGPEHIERHFWDFVFMEILRVLKPTGRLVIGYPELTTCMKSYLRAVEINDRANIDYYLQTIYGRRYWTGDEHVTGVHSPELQLILESCGYYRVRYAPESEKDSYNGLMIAFKDPSFQIRETLMAQESGLQGEPKAIQTIALEHFV